MMIRNHRRKDELELDNELTENEKTYLKRLRQKVSKINEWLEKNEDKKGSTGVIQNITYFWFRSIKLIIFIPAALF